MNEPALTLRDANVSSSTHPLDVRRQRIIVKSNLKRLDIRRRAIIRGRVYFGLVCVAAAVGLAMTIVGDSETPQKTPTLVSNFGLVITIIAQAFIVFKLLFIGWYDNLAHVLDLIEQERAELELLDAAPSTQTGST